MFEKAVFYSIFCIQNLFYDFIFCILNFCLASQEEFGLLEVVISSSMLLATFILKFNFIGGKYFL